MKKIITTAAAALTLYAIAENFLMMKVREEHIGEGSIKAVHISDLHKKSFGRNNIDLCKTVEAQNPDIIFVTGDLITRDAKNTETAEKTLKSLYKTAPVYMVYGNHEQSISEERNDELSEMIASTGTILLRNSYEQITLNGRKITIYGLCEKYTTYKKNNGYRDLDAIEKGDLEYLLGKRDGEEVWLLAHNPLFCEAYSEWGADLTFSGHIHGGAVRILNKGILSPERRFFPKYSKGVYESGGMKLLVSAGLGKLRLFDPPEIVVYYL